ncbi:phosphonatase-like hydrolase [Gordonia insulae]|uniref:Phosphonoacetaldehyde hydrolase n=1 Tax=Gordonia insulae TaxID=2420509 RepID=A0A3G8JT30_9ACTN|nr:phosphonatase-like hydrolase [Gordonia insulae]AZG48056.1 Phosphonoacetaldehyde hydrolase [Gordonia insulae]
MESTTATEADVRRLGSFNVSAVEQISLAVFDMAGTTVTDDGLVVHAFEAAATAAGMPVDGPERLHGRQFVLDTMGQSKIEVFRALLGSEDRAQTANAAFEDTYNKAIDGGVTAVPGAAEAIGRLRAAGITTAFITGFSAPTQDRIVRALGWQDLADHVLAPGDGVRGRPYPDLVLAAALRAQVDDVAHVAVVGDTSSDILTGRRAGAGVVAGVLTGAHDVDALQAAGATHVLDSVADVAALLLQF